MNETKAPLKVFLCHASIDQPKARKLYQYLKSRGIRPWLDEHDLLPGQDWKNEIPKAVADSDVIIICLTKNSVNKQGYVQNEIKLALDKALEMPDGQIFLIPLLFEKCEIPDALERYQWVDLTARNGYPKLMKALKLRASELGKQDVRSAGTTISEAASTAKISLPDGEGGQPVSQTGNSELSGSYLKDSAPDKKALETGTANPQVEQKPTPVSEAKPPTRKKIEIKTEVWAAIIVSIATIFSAWVGSRPDRPEPTATIAPTSTQPATSFITDPAIFPTETMALTNTVVAPTVAPFVVSSTLAPCPLQGQTDHETIVSLIQAEATAVNSKNYELIKTIFDPNAVFIDYRLEPPVHWNGPQARYESNLFRTTEFQGVEHFDIMPAGPGIVGAAAYYTSGSRGQYRSIGTVAWMQIKNGSALTTKYGSDQWILKKNDNGCWLIVEMHFDAGDERFP